MSAGSGVVVPSGVGRRPGDVEEASDVVERVVLRASAVRRRWGESIFHDNPFIGTSNQDLDCSALPSEADAAMSAVRSDVMAGQTTSHWQATSLVLVRHGESNVTVNRTIGGRAAARPAVGHP